MISSFAAGELLFRLDDGKKEITNISVRELYNQGTQWFSPNADNYMALIDVTPLFLDKKYKGVFRSSWKDIKKFSQEDRWDLSYRQGSSGDWKSKVARGYFLTEINGKPYWSDALGQIPFAVDFFFDYREDGYSVDESIRKTLKAGMKYGSGTITGPSDYSNGYDNYMILRTVLFLAKKHPSVERPLPPNETLNKYMK